MQRNVHFVDVICVIKSKSLICSGRTRVIYTLIYKVILSTARSTDVFLVIINLICMINVCKM